MSNMLSINLNDKRVTDEFRGVFNLHYEHGNTSTHGVQIDCLQIHVTTRGASFDFNPNETGLAQAKYSRNVMQINVQEMKEKFLRAYKCEQLPITLWMWGANLSLQQYFIPLILCSKYPMPLHKMEHERKHEDESSNITLLFQMNSSRERICLSARQWEFENIFEAVQGNRPKTILRDFQPRFGKSALLQVIVQGSVLEKEYGQNFEFGKLNILKQLNYQLLRVSVIEELGLEEYNDDSARSMVNNAYTVILLAGIDNTYKFEYEEMTIMCKGKAFWDTEFILVGSTVVNYQLFLQKFVNDNLLLKCINQLMSPLESVFDFPLSLSLLIFVMGENPEFKTRIRTDSFKTLVDCEVARSIGAKWLLEFGQNFLRSNTATRGVYHDLLRKFGELLVANIMADNLQFECKDLLESTFKVEILTKYNIQSNPGTKVFYERFHLTFLEFVAEYSLWGEFQKNGNRFSPATMNKIKEIYLKIHSTSAALRFLCGLLAEEIEQLFLQFTDLCALYSADSMLLEPIAAECDVSEDSNNMAATFTQKLHEYPKLSPTVLPTQNCKKCITSSFVTLGDEIDEKAWSSKTDDSGEDRRKMSNSLAFVKSGMLLLIVLWIRGAKLSHDKYSIPLIRTSKCQTGLCDVKDSDESDEIDEEEWPSNRDDSGKDGRKVWNASSVVLKITTTLQHKSIFVIFMFALFHCAQPLHLENIRLDKIWQEISIRERYEFISPQVHIDCTCGKNQNNCERSYNVDSPHSWEEICIIKNVSTLAHCSIKIRPAVNENQYTAYKINHSKQQVYFRISYASNNTREYINVPRGIFRIKTADNSILKLDTSNIKMDVLDAFTWFYGAKDTNNLRCGVDFNEMDEKFPSKQGWCRLNLATGKHDVDAAAVKNSLMIDDSRCPGEDVTWNFRGVHYFNQHGLLQSNLPSKTINEVTGGIVENVKINPEDKIISIEYKKNSKFVKFLPAFTSETFNFSAMLTLDKYHNKLIHIIIYEVKATMVNVEIGIPGTTRSMMTFYHEKPNQIHQYRVSGSVVGWQWVCAYPVNEIYRSTCVSANYHDESIPKLRNNASSYKFGDYPLHKPPTIYKEIIPQFSRAGSDSIINMTLMYIGIISALILVIAIVAFLFTRHIRPVARYVRPDSP